jgi:hypothetical protein
MMMLTKYIAYSKYHLKKKNEKKKRKSPMMLSLQAAKSLTSRVLLEHLQRCSVCDPESRKKLHFKSVVRASPVVLSM